MPVIKSLKQKHVKAVKNWLETPHQIDVDYPDEVQSILEHILTTHGDDAKKNKVWKKRYDFLFE